MPIIDFSHIAWHLPSARYRCYIFRVDVIKQPKQLSSQESAALSFDSYCNSTGCKALDKRESEKVLAPQR